MRRSVPRRSGSALYPSTATRSRRKREPISATCTLTPIGVTICQICKGALPFRLPDGEYYFEAVEFLPELKKHHRQNYLALCPNHAAMYMHANDSGETMEELFLDLEGDELGMTLAGEKTTVYFTGTHRVDIEAVIESEEAGR